MSKLEQSESITESDCKLTLDDFSYELDPELIAQEPASTRSSSRLMVLDRAKRNIQHKIFSDLPAFLKAGDVLVLNNTKVIPARIIAQRASGGLVEILLLKPEATRPGVWQAMANPLRKLREGEQLRVDTEKGESFLTIASFFESEDGQRRVYVDFGNHAEVHKLLSSVGQAPLPPYIVRERALAAEADFRNSDISRYQTVYASAPGAVAAPTAGLHFTEELLADLTSNGVKICYLTLHVGAGTFKPITSSVNEHTVESEEFQIDKNSADTINECKRNGGRVIAVGTTSCRSLETAGASGTLQAVENGSSSLYIKPGHKFQIVDALITNFHLSKSSLLVLVSAFAGHKLIMSAYKEAIDERYRFYSYGDAMLIL